MIQLIIGDKGSGKTKTIIEMMNSAVEETSGHIVCVEKGMKSTYNVKSDVRIIDVDDYDIRGIDAYFGFIMGVLAGDYDIEQIYLDGSLKVLNSVDDLVVLLNKLSEDAPEYVRFIMTVSVKEEEIPDGLRKFMTE